MACGAAGLRVALSSMGRAFVLGAKARERERQEKAGNLRGIGKSCQSQQRLHEMRDVCALLGEPVARDGKGSPDWRQGIPCKHMRACILCLCDRIPDITNNNNPQQFGIGHGGVPQGMSPHCRISATCACQYMSRRCPGNGSDGQAIAKQWWQRHALANGCWTRRKSRK
jgi:hypothetical protein